MKNTALVIGYGSIGKRHARILSDIVGKENITVLTKQKDIPFNTISDSDEIKNLNPDYVVVCTDTSDHLDKLLFLEKNLENKLVLVEKPLYIEYNDLVLKNNKYFVGYNLRFNPLMQILKKELKNEEIIITKAICYSYLPSWKPGIDYRSTYSASETRGGGVLLDLSHEIDSILYLFNNSMSHLWSYNKKISFLDIDSDDYFFALGKINKSVFTVETNYFSLQSKRKILVETRNKSYELDLLESSLKITSQKEQQLIEKEFKIDQTYIDQHKDILSQRFHDVCTLDEGLEILRFISEVRKLNSDEE